MAPSRGRLHPSDRVAQKHRRFAQEFFVDCDGPAAYKRTGYKGTSANVVRNEVVRLLWNPHVQQCLAEEFARLQARAQLDQERHALEVCRVAYSDLRDVCAWGPDGVQFKDSAALSPEAARTVQSVKSTTRTRLVSVGKALVPETETRIELTLHPKVPALALLQTMFEKGQATRQALEVKLRALAALAGQYVPRSAHAQYLAEVRLVLGDVPAALSGPDASRDDGTG